jgi:hypothetical protein
MIDKIQGHEKTHLDSKPATLTRSLSSLSTAPQTLENNVAVTASGTVCLTLLAPSKNGKSQVRD